MKPASFQYHRAQRLEEALELLGSAGEHAKIIAGGQSLVPLMAFRLARPDVLIDITKIEGLAYLARDDGGLRIGALTTHRSIETSKDVALHGGFELLPRVARLVGHYPIRTRGTFGGSIAHADPTAEWCLLAALADAEMVAVGPSGTRNIQATDFFQGFFTTALAPDEVLTEIRLPGSFEHAAVQEFARRQGDFAVVAAAVALELDGDRCRSARVALGGVAATPLRIADAEASLAGASLTPEAFAAAGRIAAASIDPPSDVHGSARYRRDLAAVLVKRALGEAAGTAVAPA